MWNALCYCVISYYIFSACGTRSGTVGSCVIYFLRVERALVLWNIVLYISACGTRSGIVEFCDMFCHILKVMVVIIQLIFVHVCCIFRVLLRPLHSLKQLLLTYVGKSFGQALNKTVLSELIN